MKTSDSHGETVGRSEPGLESDCSRREVSISSQCRRSSLLLAAMIAIVAGYGILVFYVPRLMAAWSKVGADLTVAQRGLAWCSHRAGETGFIVAPLLVLGLLAAFVWRIYCATRTAR